MKFENLNKEIRIGSLALNNRLVMPPMATEKADMIGIARALLRDSDLPGKIMAQ